MPERPFAYVCSPFRGDVEKNTERAWEYCHKVYEMGYMPLTPHLHFSLFLKDDYPKERVASMEMGVALLPLCRARVVCGDGITEGITADELAERANYSVGYYCRLFAQTMDSTVASYILKRRLDHALAEISSGRKAIGVVLEYGFDTYAGFYKAFVKMYGCSPKKYLSIYKFKKPEVLLMHSINEIKNILGNWDVSTNLKIEDITHTEWETKRLSEWKTWQIGDNHYLKTNERSKMIRNIKIAKAFSKEGLSSEFLPIPTKQGDDYLDGEHIFLLTRKIGEPLNLRPLTDDEIGRLENNELRDKYPYQLGQAIARLHKALKSVQGDVKPYEGNLYEQE